MRKIILSVIFVLLVLFALIREFTVHYVWVNPNVNTSSFPYISKTIKIIDKAVHNAQVSSENDIRIIYTNAYGSGFLKNNNIPNDLDYAVGIHLGKYKFDGNNAEVIATDLDRKMTRFQDEFYNYINSLADSSLYSNYNMNILALVNPHKNPENIKSMTQNIPHLFEHKMYTTYTNKILYDEDQKEFPMVFPFTLKENEILIENYNPIKLYTDTMQYSKTTTKFLREITIVLDFYADIEKDGDLVTTEIVAESFTGQRLQLTRRFFVPIIFTGNNSAKYLKNLALLNDDDKYIEYRLFNFQRHLNEFSNLKELKERPIKLFKRVLQCTDLIMPLLDETVKNDIIETIDKNLSNQTVIIINDYETALSNLLDITMMPNLTFKLINNDKMDFHINQINRLADDIESKNFLNSDEIKTLKAFNKKLTNDIKTIATKDDVLKYNEFLMKDSSAVYLLLNEKIQKSLSDYTNIIGYIDVFTDTMVKAGFHRIDLCWLDKDLMGIVKDDYTKNINDLKAMAKANRLPDVEYKLIDKSTLAGPKVRYSLWVRYGATAEEEKSWQETRAKLLKDKKNFNLKHRISL